jgi:tetratricopeptide (TPR) repeat protein
MLLRAGLLVMLAALTAGCSREAPPAAHDDHPAPEQLGRVHFDTSCTPAVQDGFDRAVALLHSFSFSVAHRAFEEVLAQDPRCAIAYWGQALSQWGNPFAGLKTGPALVAGRTAIERGLATGQPTARERAYLTAAATLFRDHETVDQRTRVLAYERAMAVLHAEYPDDREAAAFYALAVNQTALPTDKTYAQQIKAAGILEPLFAEQPEHPGLAHSIIHAYDHPPLAQRALNAARRYASIAPSAPHALHMPSHTFTRIGLWQESVDTNTRSADSALREGSPAEALHAMDYQVYAYLQMGRDRDARSVLDAAPGVRARLDPSALGGAAPPAAGLYAFAAIPARYAMERGAWEEAAALEPRPGPTPYADAVTYFARALGAARSGRPDRARADVAELASLASKLRQMNDAYWAEQVDIQRQVAAAWVAFAEGRRADAVSALRKAADAEDATDKSAVSPGPLAPARELLGEMLLAVDQPADALKAFEAVMQKEPNRFRATLHAARAAERAGEQAKARTYYDTLLEIAETGDTPGRPELEEARRASRSRA